MVLQARKTLRTANYDVKTRPETRQVSPRLPGLWEKTFRKISNFDVFSCATAPPCCRTARRRHSGDDRHARRRTRTGQR